MKKKVFIGLVGLMGLIGCVDGGMKYGKGGENAIQFVKEQVPGLRDDIASVEVIEEDSLLSDIALAHDAARFAMAGADFWQGNISREEYQRIIDERERLLYDIEYSWRFPLVVNDSLKKLSKFENQWRKVYKVLVTMKSGDTREPRVLMDGDGITPTMLERDFEMQLEEYHREILQANEDCLFGKN